MTEGRRIEDPQIELEQKKAQATEFLDVIQQTTRATGKRKYHPGSTELTIKFGLANVRFEVDNEAEGVNHAPDRMIIEQQAEQYVDKGDIAVYRVNEGGLLVRDMAVWDDTHPIYGMGFKDVGTLFPNIKASEVSSELGEVLLRFVRSPLLGKDDLPKLMAVTDADEVAILNDRRAELSAVAEENRLAMEAHDRAYRQSNPGFISDDLFDSENLM